MRFYNTCILALQLNTCNIIDFHQTYRLIIISKPYSNEETHIVLSFAHVIDICLSNL